MKPQFRACPVCRNFDTSKLITIGTIKPTFHFTLNEAPEFKLVECSVCKTIYQTPLPGEAILHELYVDNVQFTSETYTGERSKAVMEYYTNCAQNMIRMLGKNSKLSILEIGSGLSWMCHAVKELDTTSTTIAQDITPECKNICTWVDNYIVGSYEENYIFLAHLIEHVKDWKLLMEKCNRILKRGGIMYIETPSKHTVDLPTRDFYKEKGVPCTTINFRDDHTHTQTVDIDEVNSYLNEFEIIALEKGYCRSPLLENVLFIIWLSLSRFGIVPIRLVVQANVFRICDIPEALRRRPMKHKL